MKMERQTSAAAAATIHTIQKVTIDGCGPEGGEGFKTSHVNIRWYTRDTQIFRIPNKKKKKRE